MRDFVFGQTEKYKPWAEARMPFQQFEFPDGSKTISVVDGEETLCVAVYHHYNPQFRDISMSIAAASPKWASREAFGTLLGFPFYHLGCDRITTWHAADNEKIIKLVTGIGFKLEGTKRKGFGQVDTLMFGLLLEEAEPWLRYSRLRPYDLSQTGQIHGQA